MKIPHIYKKNILASAHPHASFSPLLFPPSISSFQPHVLLFNQLNQICAVIHLALSICVGPSTESRTIYLWPPLKENDSQFCSKHPLPKTSQLEMRWQMFHPPPCCNFYLWWSCTVIGLVTTAAANLCEHQPHHIFMTLFHSLPPQYLVHTFFLSSLPWCVLSFRVCMGCEYSYPVHGWVLLFSHVGISYEPLYFHYPLPKEMPLIRGEASTNLWIDLDIFRRQLESMNS